MILILFVRYKPANLSINIFSSTPCTYDRLMKWTYLTLIYNNLSSSKISKFRFESQYTSVVHYSIKILAEVYNIV